MRRYFKDKICEVWFRGALVLTGKDVGPGGLWILPIDGRASLDEEEISQEQNPPSIHSSRHSVHVAIQATKSEVHAPDVFRNAANHVRKSDK